MYHDTSHSLDVLKGRCCICTNMTRLSSRDAATALHCIHCVQDSVKFMLFLSTSRAVMRCPVISWHCDQGSLLKPFLPMTRMTSSAEHASSGTTPMTSPSVMPHVTRQPLTCQGSTQLTLWMIQTMMLSLLRSKRQRTNHIALLPRLVQWIKQPLLQRRWLWM